MAVLHVLCGLTRRMAAEESCVKVIFVEEGQMSAALKL